MIKKIKRNRVYGRVKDNIWAADVAEIGSFPSKNQGVKYLSCGTDVFTKYAWVNLWRIKKLKQSLMVLLKE